MSEPEQKQQIQTKSQGKKESDPSLPDVVESGEAHAVAGLLPCAHCGSHAHVRQTKAHGALPVYWAECFICEVGTKYHDSEKGAAATWNTRASGGLPAWQPIESAENSRGMHLLVYVPENQCSFTAYRFAGQKEWRIAGAGINNEFPETWKPSHWMPLPAPPITQATASASGLSENVPDHSPASPRENVPCLYCKRVYDGNNYCGKRQGLQPCVFPGPESLGSISSPSSTAVGSTAQCGNCGEQIVLHGFPGWVHAEDTSPFCGEGADTASPIDKDYTRAELDGAAEAMRTAVINRVRKIESDYRNHGIDTAHDKADALAYVVTELESLTLEGDVHGKRQ